MLAVVPSAAELEEMRGFELCKPEPLRALAVEAGLQHVEVRAIDGRARFRDFEEYWSPFLAGQGAAPAYLMSLVEQNRLAVEEPLRGRLPLKRDGAIELVTRAWAMRAGRRMVHTCQSGAMFWFSRKKFDGSYWRLSSMSRRYFSSP